MFIQYMELAIPLIGLGGLYLIANNKKPEPYVNSYSAPAPVRQKQEEPEELFTDLAGRQVSTTDYTQRMVPFFGKTKNIGTSLTNFSLSENVMDTLTGDGSNQLKKTENAPLFKPEESLQFTYGVPVQTDYIQERMVQSKSMNNVKPFQEQRVAPGINQGFTTMGSGGFNSGMEYRHTWQDKTVDELRVATKPKETYSLINHEGPAQTRVQNLGIEGKMEKHLPDRYYVNSPDRYFVTKTAESAPTVRSIQTTHNVNRTETTKEYQGIPGNAGVCAPMKHGMYREDHRQQLPTQDVMPSQYSVSQNNLAASNYQVLPNNRSIINHEPMGALGSLVSAITAPIKDIIKPTRKEELVGMTRTGNIGSFIPSAPVPETSVQNTIKQGTMYSPLEMGARPFAKVTDGAYTVSEQQAVSNERDTTSMEYTGIATSTLPQQRVYDTYHSPSIDKTVHGRPANGNTQVFTPNINQTVTTNRSNMHAPYLGAPQLSKSIPGPEQYNMTRSPNQYQEQSRMEPSLLDAFKQNPYTHKIGSVA
jgi:hypothetical protein